MNNHHIKFWIIIICSKLQTFEQKISNNTLELLYLQIHLLCSKYTYYSLSYINSMSYIAYECGNLLYTYHTSNEIKDENIFHFMIQHNVKFHTKRPLT